MNGWGIVFRGSNFATDFKVEVYDSIDEVWKTAAEISGNTRTEVHMPYTLWGARASKLRFTFTGYNRSDYFQISQIHAWRADQSWKEYVLYRDGGELYGDLDMNGNDILSPGLVDGVDVSAHAARHQAGGADPINVGTLPGIGWDGTAVFDGTAPTSWTSLDLSSVVGSRRTLVVLMVFNGDSNYDNGFYFRWGGSGNDFSGDPASYPAANKCKLEPQKYGMVICTTDTSGVIEWMADNAYSAKVYVLAYINID